MTAETLGATVEHLHRGHLIGGEWHDSGDDTLTVVDPSTAQQLTVLPSADATIVDAAVSAAVRAFSEWRSATPRQRGERLLALADALLDDLSTLSELEALNVGKPVAAARVEVEYCADTLRFFAGAARILDGQASTEYTPGATSVVRREPLGPVGVITPWNYPLLEAVWKLAPALAAGNTVVLKPSELTPLTTLRLGELITEIYAPGIVNILLGDGAVTGAGLVGHAAIAMVSLTGDVATGVRVAATAADTLKRVHLELGGKAPAIVLGDADPTVTAPQLGAAGLTNSGQDCTAACRHIVADEIYDEYVAALVEFVSSRTLGGPMTEDPADLGPVISERQRDRVLGFVERARGAGADVRCGGIAPEGEGFFVEPAVVAVADQDAEIIQDEVFGPVITVQRAESLPQMLAMANDVRYGLSASVWTSDLAAASTAMRELEFGTVWINDHLATLSEMPFGGFRASGYGKEMSTAAVDDYSRVKHVLTRA